MGNMEASDNQKLYDLTVIGAGPVGLFATYYAGLRDLSIKILDSLPYIGGQLTTLYPKKPIYDVAGCPAVISEELVKNLMEQVQQYRPAVVLGERIVALERLENGHYVLKGDHGTGHLSKTIIITAGIGVFAPRKLEKPEVESWLGRGFYYGVLDPEEFRGKKVMLIGGGDTALDWALMLKNIAKSLVLVHRSAKFAAHEDSTKKLLASGIPVFTTTEVEKVAGNSQIERAFTLNKQTQEKKEFEVDAVVCCIGYAANIGPLRNWGLEFGPGHTIKVNQHMETNLPGVYAAGDIAGFDGKLKLIATGFGEAAVAANYAAHHINPSAKVFPGYSTNFVEEKKERQAHPASK